MAALSGTTIGDAVLTATPMEYKGGRWTARFRAAVGALLAYMTQPVVPTLAVAAEAANVIDVTVTLKNTQGTAVAAAHTCIAYLYDADMDLVDPAAFTLAETGDGAEVSTTARHTLIFTTSAAGVATLSVTDVGGASGATKRLVVKVISDGNTLGGETYSAVTFD